MMRSKKKQLQSNKGIPGNGGKQKSFQVNIDPSTLPIVECECGNNVFIQGIRIRKLSVILSPDGKVKYIHEPVMICGKCSKLLPATP